MPVRGGWLLPAGLSIPCEKPWQCPLSGPVPTSARSGVSLKIPQVQIPAGAVGGKVQAVEGQQHLGGISGDGRREQLLTGGTLPSSWHLLILPANQVSLLPSWVGSISGGWGPQGAAAVTGEREMR